MLIRLNIIFVIIIIIIPYLFIYFFLKFKSLKFNSWKIWFPNLIFNLKNSTIHIQLFNDYFRYYYYPVHLFIHLFIHLKSHLQIISQNFIIIIIPFIYLFTHSFIKILSLNNSSKSRFPKFSSPKFQFLSNLISKILILVFNFKIPIFK